MGQIYVIAGPADAGNTLGIFRRGLIPAGRFAVVRDGEYANGGHGPIAVDGRLYNTGGRPGARRRGLTHTPGTARRAFGGLRR
jgi:hypothetical protein